MIVVEEPALLHRTPPTKKKASPTLVKKTAVITDRKKDKEPNKSNKLDKNNENVCANIKSSTSGRKQPSVINNDNKKDVQEKKFYSDDCHNEVTDMMKGTPKVSTLMELSFMQSLQIAFSSIHRGFFEFMVMRVVLLSHKTPFV